MASKRRLRRKQCGDKVRYSTLEKAKKAAWHLSNMSNRLWPYGCKYCNTFHIGHNPNQNRLHRKILFKG